jgi:alpha-tubulin suppressor-like RCC1 family protein
MLLGPRSVLSSSTLPLLLLVLASCNDQTPTAPTRVTPKVPNAVYIAPGSVAQISAGGQHTCVARSDGTVACWGNNVALDVNYGASEVPADLPPALQVSAGGSHTCALLQDHTVRCWGNNGNGQATPPSDLTNATYLAAGYAHTCAAKSDGGVVCWGANFYGESAPPRGLTGVARVFSGSWHTCATKFDGTVACWGQNNYGQTGAPAGLTGVGFVALNYSTTCAVLHDGSIQCWGRPLDLFDVPQPPDLGPVRFLALGTQHICAITSAGIVRCWGGSSFGALNPPSDLGTVRLIAAADAYTCAVEDAGRLVCWGTDITDQSTPPTSNNLRSVDIGGRSSFSSICTIDAAGALVCSGAESQSDKPPATLGPVTRVATNGQNTCAIKTDATVVCWGYPFNGVTRVPGLSNVSSISVNGGTACAVASGAVRCWGINFHGEADVPADFGAAIDVSVSNSGYSCGVKADGTVGCWGQTVSGNFFGELNPPHDLANVKEVFAASFRACALKIDQTLVCWGSSEFAPPSDLGPVSKVSVSDFATCVIRPDSSLRCFAYPPPIPAGVSTVVDVATGEGTTCVILPDHSLRCWGATSVSESNRPAPPPPGTTPPGGDVTVTPPDQTTGQPSPIDVTFTGVTTGGTTTATSSPVGGGGPPPPANFRLGSPPTYYDIHTTATVTPPIEICITWTEGTYNNEAHLKMLHFENGTWQDVTSPGYPDTQNNKICGSVSSLSPFLVAEANVSPVVGAISLPSGPIALGGAATITAGFSDDNFGDVHTAVVDWDDGTSSSGTVTETFGSGSVQSTHTYLAPGVYTVGVKVSDGDLTGSRSSSASVPAYIVVYDGSAGFVTGGGWIASPAGAYAPIPALVGRASFGFVARYQKGANAPDGSTEFQFQVAGLVFQSTSYQWLVVAGSKAQIKGEGTLNGGTTRYGFLLTAIDGQFGTASGPDQFRIKIWDGNGSVVYDNRRVSSEDSSDATTLGGGSIVIHK